MRMRKRHNLVPRMERCADKLISDPDKMINCWRNLMPGCTSLWLELGCGKGRFTADLAASEPETLLIALERVPDAMIIAMERVKNAGLDNVRFIDADAKLLPEFFGQAEVDRIFINFCDPWPKSRDAKLRLTAPSFLRRYSDILPVGGEIHFKTDDDELFAESLVYFKECGFEIKYITYDLHNSGYEPNIVTEHEKMFSDEGIKIKFLIAQKTVLPQKPEQDPQG